MRYMTMLLPKPVPVLKAMLGRHTQPEPVQALMRFRTAMGRVVCFAGATSVSISSDVK